MVGLIPLFAVETLDSKMVDQLPGFKRRMEWFVENRKDLTANVACMQTQGEGSRRLLSIVNADQLRSVLKDVTGVEIQRVDVGDASRTVDDAVGIERMFEAVLDHDHPEAPVARLDPQDGDRRPHLDSDAFGLGPELRDGVGIHRRQQMRQGFQDGDVGAGAGVDVAELQ